MHKYLTRVICTSKPLLESGLVTVSPYLISKNKIVIWESPPTLNPAGEDVEPNRIGGVKRFQLNRRLLSGSGHELRQNNQKQIKNFCFQLEK